jgi:hypothetical protein
MANFLLGLVGKFDVPVDKVGVTMAALNCKRCETNVAEVVTAFLLCSVRLSGGCFNSDSWRTRCT